MTDKYTKQADEPLRQANNSSTQTRQRERYRRQIDGDTEPNTGLPEYQNAKNQTQKKGRWHKSSQDPDMLQKDDRILDDDNNMRKDADVNLDQKNELL